MGEYREVFGQQISETALAMQLAEASELPTTGPPGEGLPPVLGLAAPFAGKKILDVASGCSDLVHWLCQQGAKATAVDPAYANVESMLAKATDYRSKHIISDTQAALNSILDPSYADFFDDGIAGPLRRFEQDFRDHPERYIAASIDDLPFPDGEFDDVICTSFLTTSIGRYRELVFAGSSELLRVTKPGGTVRVGALLHTGQPMQTEENRKIIGNLEAVAEAAKRQKVIRKMARLSVPNPGTMPAWTFRFDKR